MNLLIRKRIHANKHGTSTADIIVERWIWDVFTPFVGLYIWDSNDFEAELTQISWKVGSGFFECWTESHREERPVDEIAKDYLQMGWKRA